jgi:hypothetical protein
LGPSNKSKSATNVAHGSCGEGGIYAVTLP